jgi:hypothetical protein
MLWQKTNNGFVVPSQSEQLLISPRNRPSAALATYLTQASWIPTRSQAEAGRGAVWCGDRRALPMPLRRSLACTNSIGNIMGTVRRVCRNVKRWRMPRWHCAGPA